jgi:hypothetical protein
MILTELSNYSVKGLKVELAAAGHNYTNKLSDSIEYKFFKGGLSKIYVEDYGIDINEGYSAEDAKKRVKKIGSDQYIDELKDWFENKLGIDEEFSYGLAVGTFYNHLVKGYKSKRSGFRENEGFIDFVKKELEKAGVDIIGKKSDDLTVLLYRELLYLADKNFKITLKDVGGFSRNKNISNIF